MVNKSGSELFFISRIKRDGSGVETVKEREVLWQQNESFNVNVLSLSEETYIASGFNSYIVKLK